MRKRTAGGSTDTSTLYISEKELLIQKHIGRHHGENQLLASQEFRNDIAHEEK